MADTGRRGNGWNWSRNQGGLVGVLYLKGTSTFNGDKELLAIADGALGFREALLQVFPSTRM